MAVLRKDSNIPRFLPSLAHIAVVRVVTSYFLDLLNDVKTMERVYTDIQNGISASLNKRSKNYHKAERAREKLLFIPAHLRHTVYTTIRGMRYDMNTCVSNNIATATIPGLKEINFFFKSDGTVDRIKVAQRFVLNENVNIRLRFYVACLHYFEGNVVSLWKQMEALGETQNFDTGNKLMVKFWVKWIQEGSRIPWLQALKEYFISTPELVFGDRLLVRHFFALLQPEERDKFLIYLKWTFDYDDFRFCLCAATKEEEVKIRENIPLHLLIHHLNWPLQSIFLEVAEMVWHFLDVSSFIEVLMFIWHLRRKRKDFDYCQLFLAFWNRCPITLKESVKENPTMSKRINSILNRITNQKMWIRRGGRLKSITQTSCLTSKA